MHRHFSNLILFFFFIYSAQIDWLKCSDVAPAQMKLFRCACFYARASSGQWITIIAIEANTRKFNKLTHVTYECECNLASVYIRWAWRACTSITQSRSITPRALAIYMLRRDTARFHFDHSCDRTKGKLCMLIESSDLVGGACTSSCILAHIWWLWRGF